MPLHFPQADCSRPHGDANLGDPHTTGATLGATPLPYLARTALELARSFRCDRRHPTICTKQPPRGGCFRLRRARVLLQGVGCVVQRDTTRFDRIDPIDAARRELRDPVIDAGRSCTSWITADTRVQATRAISSVDPAATRRQESGWRDRSIVDAPRLAASATRRPHAPPSKQPFPLPHTQPRWRTAVDRRDFLKITGLGLGALMMLPMFGRAIAAEVLADHARRGAEESARRRRAQRRHGSRRDATATCASAATCTSSSSPAKTRSQNVVNTESTGVGVRVIADGTWGFAATSDLDADGVASAARAGGRDRQGQRAGCRPSRCSSRRRKGVGEVVVGDADREERVRSADQGEGRPAARRQRRRDRRPARTSSTRSCSWSTSRSTSPRTDGSYIDQDVHRIWPPFTVTAVDKASGKFRTRDGLSAPMGMGYEYLDARRRATRSRCPAARSVYAQLLRHGRGRASPRPSRRKEKLTAPVGRSRASTTSCSIRRTCG